MRIRGTKLKTVPDYNVASDETVTGNILELLTKSWEQLRPHLVETKFSQGALFRERVMYPEDAVREAVINAITHRDYSIEGKNIEINIFDDRMEVQSPGSLLSTISIDDLRKQKGVHESRNAHVARVLKEIGYVREMGEGMRRIFRLMNDADLVPPGVASEQSLFSVSLFHKSVFSSADQLWLAGYRPLKLSREEMLVAMLGKDGKLISPQEIYNLLGLHDWDVYRSVFEQLACKAVLFNTMSEVQKKVVAKRRGSSKRNVQRLAVRQPHVLEEALGVLFVALGKRPITLHIDSNFVKTLLDSLPNSHIYNTNVVRLTKLLRILGLMDAEGTPAASLLELWRQSSLVSGTKNADVSSGTARVSPRAIKAPSKSGSTEPEAIYVGNLNFDVSERDLADLFGQYGTVFRVKIPVDYITRKGRGFGFVTMADRKVAGQVMELLQGRELMGRPLRLSWQH